MKNVILMKMFCMQVGLFYVYKSKQRSLCKFSMSFEAGGVVHFVKTGAGVEN